MKKFNKHNIEVLNPAYRKNGWKREAIEAGLDAYRRQARGYGQRIIEPDSITTTKEKT